MVQWQNPALLAHLDVINVNIIFLLLGLFGWEYLQSFDVEYAVILGRLSFRWPLVPYIIGRLCLLASLLLTAIKTYPSSHELMCFAGIVSVSVTGNITIGCTSINFMIRTWAIWRDSRLVRILLSIVTLGHWSILWLDIAMLQSTQVHGQCAVRIAHQAVYTTVLVYTLCYDFFILVLSILGLSRQSSKSPLTRRLRRQGLLYFTVAFILYIPPAVFALLDVDDLVSITGLSALTASTIASCRAVRSLLCLGGTSHFSQPSDESTEDSVALTTHVPLHMTLLATASGVPVGVAPNNEGCSADHISHDADEALA